MWGSLRLAPISAVNYVNGAAPRGDPHTQSVSDLAASSVCHACSKPKHLCLRTQLSLTNEEIRRPPSWQRRRQELYAQYTNDTATPSRDTIRRALGDADGAHRRETVKYRAHYSHLEPTTFRSSAHKLLYSHSLTRYIVCTCII